MSLVVKVKHNEKGLLMGGGGNGVRKRRQKCWGLATTLRATGMECRPAAAAAKEAGDAFDLWRKRGPLWGKRRDEAQTRGGVDSVGPRTPTTPPPPPL